jgi:TonB family protein
MSRNYLLYSSSAHAALLAALFLLSPAAGKLKKKEQAYFIDFVGGSKVVSMQPAAKAEPAPAVPAARPQPSKTQAAKADPDDFLSGPLPKPSVLSGIKEQAAPAARPAAPSAQETQGEEGAYGGSETALVTDSGNFPYPWYLAQVREALWSAWTGKMPSGGRMRATVRFVIKRGGDIKAVSVTKGSGNRLFDYAAEAAVQSSAPFPPLPDDFFEDTLAVNVEFKTLD